MSRRAGAVAKSLARATASDASRKAGGSDPLAPLDAAPRRCFWCGERRVTRLRVGLLTGIGYGAYCAACGKDGSGKGDADRPL